MYQRHVLGDGQLGQDRELLVHNSDPARAEGQLAAISGRLLIKVGADRRGMGMAEQAMLGAAAGLAEVGLVPFASTYSVFATRRAYDFLCLDIAEPGLNVNVVGALPGLTTGYGPSHQATEDLAILRGCPGLTIVDPCDSVDIEQAVPALAATPGPTYMRLLRGAVPTVLDEYGYRFEVGKAAELRTGRDVVIISTGLMTMRALQAAARLEADHVDVAVLHVPTIKPLDREAILFGHPRWAPRRHLREPHRGRWAHRVGGRHPCLGRPALDTPRNSSCSKRPDSDGESTDEVLGLAS
jgi:pyruvate/2-oxoglutarate/acetoin dehydrogenase E1 component